MTSTGEQIVNRFVTTLNERDFDGFEALSPAQFASLDAGERADSAKCFGGRYPSRSLVNAVLGNTTIL
jgi:hypothetical protein